MGHALSVMLLFTWLFSSPCRADAPPYPPTEAPLAPIGGDGAYALAPGGGLTPSFSRADETWYRRNRRIALAGKVLTVLGVSITLASAFTDEQLPLLFGGVATQYLGQVIWSAAELRGANEMARRGFGVSNVAGIVAVFGAFLLSPVAWVAGSIQSAQLRRAHDDTRFGSRGGPTFASYGLGYRATF
jgi:hypothetical protein